MMNKYSRLGLQRKANELFVPNGLNTSVPLLPQLLHTAGYKAKTKAFSTVYFSLTSDYYHQWQVNSIPQNYLVGKWHLGFCHEDYLPNKRGFDYFFGQYGNVNDYYRR